MFPKVPMAASTSALFLVTICNKQERTTSSKKKSPSTGSWSCKAKPGAKGTAGTADDCQNVESANLRVALEHLVLHGARHRGDLLRPPAKHARVSASIAELGHIQPNANHE